MRFSNEFIEKVQQANDIVSVISDYVTLKRRGRNFWACCPFHNEKTASFSVSPDKGFYYCFGCHASGNVFKFLMQKENLTFVEAVTRLAERAHIALPEVEKRDRLRHRLFEINEMAGNFFHNCLVKTRYGEAGLDYYHRRHVSNETIHDFKLGFAPDGWTMLTDAFVKRGVDPEDLVLLGLSKKKNDHYYDAFRNRVIFPIRDGRSRIVGFGGRVLDDSKPKYLNSPETPIFNKRRLLFAMDMAHKAIYQEGKAILVEGYMDVVAAHNKGIHNVVASLGTSFTPEQARLLQRQAKNLVLSYDMDQAGRQATLRAMQIVRGLGMHISVVSLPQGKDPDEYINSAGPDAFREAVSSAPNVLDYMLQTGLKQYDRATLEGKSSIVSYILPVAAAVENRVVLEEFLKKVAAAVQVDENAVRSEFNKYVAGHPEAGQTKVVISSGVPQANAAARGAGTMAVAEENILRYLLEDPIRCGSIKEKVEPAFFADSRRRHIYETLVHLYDEEGTYGQTQLQELLPPEEQAEVARIMVLQDVPVGETVVMDYVKRFHVQMLQQEYAKHSKLAAVYSSENDPRFIDELEACKAIREKMKQWS